MTVSSQVKRFARLLLWRHRLLWTYRVDLYLSILLFYVLCFTIVGGAYIYSNRSIKQDITGLVADFDTKASQLRELVVVARTRPFTPDEFTRLQTFVIADPKDPAVVAARTTVTMRYSINYRGFPQEQSKVLVEKLEELTILRWALFSRIHSSYLFLGNTLGSVGAILAWLSPIVLLAFYILNVFRSKDTHVVLKHPMFLVLMFQLLSLLIMPIALATLLEHQFKDVQEAILNSSLGKRDRLSEPGFDIVSYSISIRNAPGELMHSARAFMLPKEDIGSIAAFMLPREDIGKLPRSKEELRYFISDYMFVLLAFVSWIACGLRMVKRFGGALFLACSTAALTITIIMILLFGKVAGNPFVGVKVSALSITVGSRDPGLSLLWAIPIVVFASLFLGGMFLRYYRAQLLCTGFIGVVVASCGFTGTFVSAQTATLATLCELLVAIVILVAAIEWLMQRAMFRYLYEPQ